ncbi:nucleotide exchange factor for Gsp1p, localizes to the nucleus, partial [Nadsonia fulvescens var. elongata DSM 6958]
RRPRGAVDINAPATRKTEKLNVYVFGSGSMCELGLGPASKTKEVKRPRINSLVPIETVGIVDIAVGGAHTLCLDHAGSIWSWGGNDHGVLGRDTSKAAEQLKDMDAGSDSEDDDDGDLNELESTPAKVEDIPEGVKFVQVTATDNLSAALTEDGEVYTWGTFRNSEGVMGFNEQTMVQRSPVKMAGLNHIVQLAAGKDHMLALTTWGAVFAWGNGQQFQLGRKVLERSKMQGLSPREFGLKHIKFIGCGEFHAFAIDNDNRVMSWGLNQFGQCGLSETIEDGAMIDGPTYVDALDGKNITYITGGEHHSLALNEAGQVYVFGRIDSHECGIAVSDLPEYVVKDAGGRARCIPKPTLLTKADNGDEEDSDLLPPCKVIAAGSHHNLAISKTDGAVFSWGFGESYQVGQGPDGDDVATPTKIQNTATKGVNMVFAGAGGQFSVIAGLPKEN